MVPPNEYVPSGGTPTRGFRPTILPYAFGDVLGARAVVRIRLRLRQHPAEFEEGFRYQQCYLNNINFDIIFDMKRIRWIGTSREDIRRFPEPARLEAGYQIYRVQLGMDPKDWKPMPTIGVGVREIRVRAGGAYRVIYTAQFEDAIYVLHAFEKKTQKTARRDVEVARSRFKELVRSKP